MTPTAEFCPECGTRMDAAPEAELCPGCLLRAGMHTPFPAEELARLFPQLEVYELIGRGGMGAVHRARQRSLDREVALKLLPVELSRQPGFAARFEREARAMARLDHPHIVTVFDFGEAGGHSYLVMEYVRGLNLRQLIEQRRLKPAEALALIPQICDALQYAHDRGVVHRDIKPENILVDEQGRVRIADFGLAKLAGLESTRLTASHQVMGTPRYMAPEQIEGSHAVDHRADIYSLGIVFYEMLTGELPLGRFDPPSRRVEVDVRLDEVVLRALEKEPGRRYQAAGEVKTAVLQMDGAAPSSRTRAEQEEVEEDNEGLAYALLCIALPSLAFMGVLWSGSWWPLVGLFLCGIGVGSCMPGKPLDTSGQLFVALVCVFSLAAIGASMATLQSASPLWALPLFLWGLASGRDDQRRKLAAREAGDSGAEDEADD